MRLRLALTNAIRPDSPTICSDIVTKFGCVFALGRAVVRRSLDRRIFRMNPRLYAVDGPLKDRTLHLSEATQEREIFPASRMERSLVGESARMREIDQFLIRVAPADSTVLLEGESGTG